MKIRPLHHIVTGVFIASLLVACSDDKPEEKTAKKGVFTPYVEAHNEAQEAANLANEAMKRNEERMQQRD